MTSSLNIIPVPKAIQLTGGWLSIEQKLILDIQRYTIDQAIPSGINHQLTKSIKSPEGYRLTIAQNGIAIHSQNKQGLFYAIQTLRQILHQSENMKIPLCEVDDAPGFPNRAVLLDISRDRVPNVKTLKNLIDLWAQWKYNEVQLYTEHTFAYSQHREVWQHASPFTAQEIGIIKDYCRQRGITLVPNQNSFGHMERWLCHDSYKHLAESPDGFIDPWDVFRPHSSTLAPSVPENLVFLEGLYDELLPCFDSKFLNVGGDELWELGKGRSSQLCQTQGTDKVYLDFILKLHKLAAKKGCKIQVYGDIIMKYPHLIKDLPKDMILINWGYEADHPFEDECEKIAAAGIPFYVCAGTSSWNSIGGRWSNTYGNLKNAAENAKRFGASGLMVAEWGDNGHWQQYPIALPGFLLGAAAAWNPSQTASFDPIQAMSIHLFNNNRTLAKAALNLQNIWEQSGIKLHNGSLPAFLLLDPLYPYYRQDYPKFHRYEFKEECNLLAESKSLLSQVSHTDSAADSCNEALKEELLFSAKLLQHGCHLGRQQLATTHLTVAEIPLEERKKLKAELEPLIAEYRDLWLRRYRVGGLTDSIMRMEMLMKSYM